MSKKEKSMSVNKKTLGRILKYIKRYSFLVVLSLICAAISVVLTLYAPIITGHMVDKIVGKGAVDFGALKTLAIRFVIVVAVTAVCQWIMNILNNKVTYHVVNNCVKPISRPSENWSTSAITRLTISPWV